MKKKIFYFMLSLVTMLTSLFVLAGCGKNDDKKNGEAEDGKASSASIDYITEDGNNYIFIDSNGKLVKIAKSKFGEVSASSDGYKHNSIFVNTNDVDYLMDFNGKVLYEEKNYLSRIVETDEDALYQFKTEDRKYGIINSQGKVVIEATNSNVFERVNSDYGFFYTADYNRDTSKYNISLYDITGKKVFEEVANDNPFNYVAKKVGNNVITTFRKDENTVYVLNMTSGEIVQTITDSTSADTVDIDREGNMLEVSWYKGRSYSAAENAKKAYYIFNESNKVAQKFELDKSTIGNSISSNRENGLTSRTENKEKTIYDRYGNKIYTSSGSTDILYNYNKMTDETVSFIREKTDSKSYNIINEKGTVVLKQNINLIGSNYILTASKELYKFDGTKYMDNVAGLTSFYGLDLITTTDGTKTLENASGKKVSFDTKVSENKFDKLTNDTIAYKNDKELMIINVNDLSIKKIDTSEYKYVFIENGYIKLATADKYVYMNSDGKEIYSCNV